jgi:acyl-coenzyme A thioesterase PaaI-like protein
MKNMDRWLGDGGMEIIGSIGGRFEAYGMSGDDSGWVSGSWEPTTLACNPRGVVQAGVHGVILDAAMNFAVNAGLEGRDRARATLAMNTELVRTASASDRLSVRGEVSRMARQVAYAQASVRDGDGRLVSRATATFLLQREG